MHMICTSIFFCALAFQRNKKPLLIQRWQSSGDEAGQHCDECQKYFYLFSFLDKAKPINYQI